MNKKNNAKPRIINLEVTSKEDKEILQKALPLLDRLGYTIAKKNSLVLDSEFPLSFATEK